MGDGGAFRRTVQAHHVGAAAESAHRKTAADNLPQRGHVRRNAVVFLGSAGGDAEADNLIEDQQSAAVVGEIPQHGEIRGFGRQHSDRTHHRLHDHCGQLIAVSLQDASGGLHIVVGDYHRLIQRAFRQATTGRNRLRVVVVAARCRVDPQADQNGIMGSVVAAFHFGELAAPGECAGGPQGVQRRLGTGVGETHLLERGDAFAQQAGQLDLMPVGGVIRQAQFHLLTGRLQHRGRAVAQDHGGHRVDEIQALHAIGIRDHRALGGLGEDRIGIPENGMPAVAIGQITAGFLPDRAGFGGSFQVAGYFVVWQLRTPVVMMGLGSFSCLRRRGWRRPPPAGLRRGSIFPARSRCRLLYQPPRW